MLQKILLCAGTVLLLMLIIAIYDVEVEPGSSRDIMHKHVQPAMHLTSWQFKVFIHQLWYDFGQYVIIAVIGYVLWRVIKK
ncbi:hypothetical protein FJY93_01195 [Candidatus Kaiserbacteria bacterium]|nr:hypothetical protein [Candidatus Kaiserbacteria bacterium]